MRPRRTAAERIADVRAAMEALPALIDAAEQASATHGDADTRALRAWEHVERHGATVHRQARLLAGKSRGG